MNPSELFSAILILLGALFFFAGTLGLIRFPDVFTRLHAITKADNLGLGLTVLGLVWQTGLTLIALKLLLIWLLILLASTVSCQLVARYALRSKAPSEGKNHD